MHIGLLKQAIVVFVSATLSMEEEVKNLMREYTMLKDLVENKLQRVKIMESTLGKEKTTKAQYQ